MVYNDSIIIIISKLYSRDAQPAARWPDPAPERVLSGPRSRLKKYKKRFLSAGDFMNELKFSLKC